MRRTIILFLALFAAVAANTHGNEQVLLVKGDLYSCDLVLMDSARVVVLLFAHRVELPMSEVRSVSFENSEDEMEIVLKDDTVLKGQIVGQDADFYTIGTTAGLNTIDKAKIKEIRNPRYLHVENPDVVSLHVGLVPAYTRVLGGFGESYNTFWSTEAYVEVSFLENLWIGASVDFLMLSPEFDSTNEILFLIPVHASVKYERPFAGPEEPQSLLSRLYWHVEFGLGAGPVMLREKAEARTTASIAMCTAAGYGLKFAISKTLSLGIAGKTSVVLQTSTHVLSQSGSLFLEATF